mgnify:CR=1 FL=1
MEPLDEIYRKYSQKVYLFLLGKTENANLAEELTQETFFWQYRASGIFAGRAAF